MSDAYLSAIEACGDHGFCPVGQLYASILAGYCDRGLMSYDGVSFRLTDYGREELARQRAAGQPKTEVSP